MQIVLVTLADDRCRIGQSKVESTAKQFGKVDPNVIGWTWKDFQKTEHYKQNPHIFSEKRGLGYWSWKPFIILDAMERIQSGDFILYHDAGRPCYNWHIDFDVHPFAKYIKQNHQGLGIVFGPWNHGKMTKRDCLIHMQCDEPAYHKHKQVSATWSLWEKNDFCLRVLDEWKRWVVHSSRIVTDDSSSIAEHSFFNAHRHDQSILTNILLKKVFAKEYKPLFNNGYEKNINNILKLHTPLYPEYANNEPIPVSISEDVFIFYDVFIHDDGYLCGIGPYYPHKVSYSDIVIKCQNKEFSPIVVEDPHKHTIIMKFNIKCSKQVLISLSYKNTVIKTFTVTKHDYEPKNIVATTMFKNCSPFLRQWIEYHWDIGVEHFYLYDNNSDDFDQVKRICDEYSHIVTLIKWPYPYKTPGRGNSLSGQTSEQNTSIYKYSRHKWMVMTDLDEYVYSQSSSLRSILNSYSHKVNEICGITLPCQWFGCGKNVTYDDDFLHKMIWRKSTSNKPKPGCSPKQIVVPKNVQVFSVHRCIKGKPEVEMDDNILRFNHYFSLTNDTSRYVARTTGLRIKSKNACNCSVLCDVKDTGLSTYIKSIDSSKNKNVKFAFISIPKNASQSIFDMFDIKLKDYSNVSDTGIFDNHCRAAVLKKRYNDYTSRFTFCFVRNPFQRIISWYEYHKNCLKLPFYKRFTFEQWIKAGFPHHWGLQNGTRYKKEKRSPLDQFEFIYDDENNLLVDYIGHIETFDEDLKYICSKLNFSNHKPIHKNKSNKCTNWKSYYTHETFKLTQSRFIKDIKLFGYEHITL